MTGRGTSASSVLMAGALFAATVSAQQPRITNARLTPHTVTNLSQTFQSLVSAQTDVAWIAYAVPVRDRGRSMCCWTSGDGSTYISDDGPCCGMCKLEPASPVAGSARPPAGSSSAAQGPVKLEGPERMIVLFRVIDRRVERVRSFSETCDLDAGGRPVHWLESVRPGDSLTLLASLVGGEPARRNRVTGGALQAMSMHGEAGAAEMIEQIARTHKAPAVRGDALFWLAQMAGDKVAAAITSAIENDPETEVKRRAVFALSQLPRDEGVPLLIDVARKNRNPVVRKQAIFWLGQSKDPRAIEFFAEILR
jgi:hypothetical protein